MNDKMWRFLIAAFRRLEYKVQKVLTPPFVVVSAIVGLVMDSLLEAPFLIAMTIGKGDECRADRRKKR